MRSPGGFPLVAAAHIFQRNGCAFFLEVGKHFAAALCPVSGVLGTELVQHIAVGMNAISQNMQFHSALYTDLNARKKCHSAGHRRWHLPQQCRKPCHDL